MITVIGNGNDDTCSNLDKAVYIPDITNNLEKAMNPFILSPAMGK